MTKTEVDSSRLNRIRGWIRKRPKRSIFLAVVVLAYWQSNAIYRGLTWGVDAAYTDIEFRGPADGKTIYLTIDDSADVESTPEILDVLKAHDVRATFFVISDYTLGERAALVERIDAEGHTVAHHMQSGRPVWSMTLEDFKARFDVAEKRMRSFGLAPMMRPGDGLIRDEQSAYVKAKGYRVVLGTVFPFDQGKQSEGLMRYFISKTVHPGAIIILHDSHSRGLRTARVLDAMIPELKQRGYRFGLLHSQR